MYEIFVSIMIIMLKSPHNSYNILLYHSNGTKGTSQKRKHEEGENEKVAKTNKSKFMKMKRGNNVRINTYTASRSNPLE